MPSLFGGIVLIVFGVGWAVMMFYEHDAMFPPGRRQKEPGESWVEKMEQEREAEEAFTWNLTFPIIAVLGGLAEVIL